MRRATAGIVLAVAAASCTGGGGVPDGVDVADGWTVEVVRDDLDGPTQLSTLADGYTVVVAELGGGEDAGRGRVLDLGDHGGADEPIELLDGLLTPTGLAMVGPTTLYVQEQEALSAVTLEGQTPFAPARPPTGASARVLHEGLPFNGRSQGTLTLVGGDGGGRLLLATATGSGVGPDVPQGSGRLYAAGLEDGEQERTIAVGFKNAYAHALGPDGELYVTEVGDGTYDGERPPDELNVIPAEVWRGALRGGEPHDGGWPDCIGANEPTEAFGVTRDDCAALPPPLALFPPQSTPTSVAVGGDGRVLVALWVEGRVVEVDPDDGEVTDVVTGLDGPQHLLARRDGSYLLTVHRSGHLLRLAPPTA